MKSKSPKARLIPISFIIALITAWTAPSSGEEELSTRTFDVPINFYDLVAKPPEDFSDPFDPDPPRGIMEHHGVVFGPGCRALLNTEKGLLEVTNTAAQLELMEKIVSKLPKLTFAEEKLLVSSIVRGPEVPTDLVENPTVKKIKKILQEIRIPDLKIENHTFTDALDMLQQKSIEFHTNETTPSRKGVSLIVDGNPSPFIETPDGYQTPSMTKIVSLHRRDISLADAFEDLAKQADYKYHVEPHAVIFTPASAPVEKIYTAKYFLPLEFYEKLLAFPDNGHADPFGPRPSDITLQTAQSALEYSGISFLSNAHARYDRDKEELFITNSVNQMDLVASLLIALDPGKVILAHDSRYHREPPE